MAEITSVADPACVSEERPGFWKKHQVLKVGEKILFSQGIATELVGCSRHRLYKNFPSEATRKVYGRPTRYWGPGILREFAAKENLHFNESILTEPTLVSVVKAVTDQTNGSTAFSSEINGKPVSVYKDSKGRDALTSSDLEKAYSVSSIFAAHWRDQPSNIRDGEVALRHEDLKDALGPRFIHVIEDIDAILAGKETLREGSGTPAHPISTKESRLQKAIKFLEDFGAWESAELFDRGLGSGAVAHVELIKAEAKKQKISSRQLFLAKKRKLIVNVAPPKAGRFVVQEKDPNYKAAKEVRRRTKVSLPLLGHLAKNKMVRSKPVNGRRLLISLTDVLNYKAVKSKGTCWRPDNGYWFFPGKPLHPAVTTNGRQQIPAEPATETRELANDSQPLVLGARDEFVIVDRVKKRPLTRAQYDVVKALLVAGKAGLSGRELDDRSGHPLASRILKDLASKDDHWKGVLEFPGKPWGRYRIRGMK